jgi:hypothetical protein
LGIDTDTTEGALQQGMTLILADTIDQQTGKVPLKNHVNISLESQRREKKRDKSIDDTKLYVTVYTKSQQHSIPFLICSSSV